LEWKNNHQKPKNNFGLGCLTLDDYDFVAANRLADWEAKVIEIREWFPYPAQ